MLLFFFHLKFEFCSFRPARQFAFRATTQLEQGRFISRRLRPDQFKGKYSAKTLNACNVCNHRNPCNVCKHSSKIFNACNVCAACNACKHTAKTFNAFKYSK